MIDFHLVSLIFGILLLIASIESVIEDLAKLQCRLHKKEQEDVNKSMGDGKESSDK